MAKKKTSIYDAKGLELNKTYPLLNIDIFAECSNINVVNKRIRYISMPETDTQTDETFAVIPTGGKQYIVHEGDELDVEKIDAEEGEEVEFEAVLMTGKADDVEVGDPEADATVVGEVVEHGKGEKIEVMKFKRKKNYKRVRGHRQPYTTIRITDIS
jgi:large subunit ribosomal protein L21